MRLATAGSALALIAGKGFLHRIGHYLPFLYLLVSPFLVLPLVFYCYRYSFKVLLLELNWPIWLLAESGDRNCRWDLSLQLRQQVFDSRVLKTKKWLSTQNNSYRFLSTISVHSIPDVLLTPTVAISFTAYLCIQDLFEWFAHANLRGASLFETDEPHDTQRELYSAPNKIENLSFLACCRGSRRMRKHRMKGKLETTRDDKYSEDTNFLCASDFHSRGCWEAYSTVISAWIIIYQMEYLHVRFCMKQTSLWSLLRVKIFTVLYTRWKKKLRIESIRWYCLHV